MFTLSGINSTDGITIGGNVVTVPKNIRVGKVTVSGDDYKLAEDTPAEDTPAEDTPVEDTPAEDTPVEDTPVEDTPAEEITINVTIKISSQSVKIIGDDSFSMILKKLLK